VQSSRCMWQKHDETVSCWCVRAALAFNLLTASFCRQNWCRGTSLTRSKQTIWCDLIPQSHMQSYLVLAPSNVHIAQLTVSDVCIAWRQLCPSQQRQHHECVYAVQLGYRPSKDTAVLVNGSISSASNGNGSSAKQHGQRSRQT
jgi:hypothetical protein